MDSYCTKEDTEKANSMRGKAHKTSHQGNATKTAETSPNEVTKIKNKMVTTLDVAENRHRAARPLLVQTVRGTAITEDSWAITLRCSSCSCTFSTTLRVGKCLKAVLVTSWHGSCPTVSVHWEDMRVSWSIGATMASLTPLIPSCTALEESAFPHHRPRKRGAVTTQNIDIIPNILQDLNKPSQNTENKQTFKTNHLAGTLLVLMEKF